jgi:ABC-type antimicrobial peptide transport system permease subunit
VAIPGAEFYLPGNLRPPQTGNLVVRAEGDPLRLVNGIRAQVVAIDSNQPISNVKTMDDLLESTVGRQRLMVVLLGFFASAALLLAIIGLYGVISYSVVRRTPELAVRRALGADRKEIMRLVMGEGLALTVAGVWIGIGTAIGVTRAMQSLLFGISPTDPATFSGIALAFILVALGATYLPARAAARVDPITALR